MELIDIRKKTLVIFSFAGALAGLVIYLLPQKYAAVGSFYIRRAVYPSSATYFNYDGYYGQQTAISFTNTVVSLLTSADVESQALRKLGITPTGDSLRRVNRLIGATKSGPQVVSLTTKGKTPEDARKLWLAVSKSLLETTTIINADGDQSLGVTPVSDGPVIKEPFQPLYLYLPIGFLSGLLAGLLFIYAKEYFK